MDEPIFSHGIRRRAIDRVRAWLCGRPQVIPLPQEDPIYESLCRVAEHIKAAARADDLEYTRLEGPGASYIWAHPESKCDGGPCPVHNRSDHHMRGFRQNWRDDRGVMERICPHGVGHPDPDCREHAKDMVHGCEGCCAPPTTRAFKRMLTE